MRTHGFERHLHVLLAAAVLGALTSLVLAFHHGAPEGAWGFLQSICGPQAGCDVVNRSAAAELAGVPLAVFGFAFYASMVVLIVLAFGRSEFTAWIVGASFLGLLVDAGLLAYSLFGLGALCGLCAVTYVATLFLLVVSGDLQRRRLGLGDGLRAPLGPVFSMRGARAALVFGGLAVLSTSALVNQVSHERDRERMDEDPDAALLHAWSVFLDRYLETERVSIDTTGAAKRGAARPVLELVLFADFLCSHCRRTAKLLGDFADDHRDTVRLVHMPYPLDGTCNPESDQVHPGACQLARAAESARLLGGAWPFLEGLYARQELWRGGVAPTQLSSLALESGMDPDAFLGHLGSTAVDEAVRRQVEEAERVGVTSTPTLFVNGRRMGSIPIRTFLEELLREEAKHYQPFTAFAGRGSR